MEIQYRTELPKKKALFALYEHLMWNDSLKLSQDQLMEAMKGSIFSVYAYCGNQLVGTGRVVSDGTISAYLCGLGMHSDYRNRGIGTAMMKRLCQFCTDRRLHIQFFCEDHLVPFYERMGFTLFASGMRKP